MRGTLLESAVVVDALRFIDSYGWMKKRFLAKHQDDIFCPTSLLLTLGRSKNCSCSWRRPRRRSTSFKNKYVLSTTMSWGRILGTISLLVIQLFNFRCMLDEMRTIPACRQVDRQTDRHTHTHTHTRTLTLTPAHACSASIGAPLSKTHQAFGAEFLSRRNGSKEKGLVCVRQAHLPL